MKYCVTLIASITLSLNGLSDWRIPEKDVRYHEACFLTSHNSYAAKNHGYWYAQQTLTIKEQLEAGVRGLMLDIHEDTNHTIVLGHGNIFITQIICRGKKPMPFQEALSTIKKFLEANPGEVITIFLENYVENPLLLDAAFSYMDLDAFILKPNEWDPVRRKGWPKFAWLQQKNKQLIVFNCRGETIFTFNQWQHVRENQWGAVHMLQACKERPESKKWQSHPRYLYCVNYFPRVKFNSYTYTNSTALTAFLKKLLTGIDTGQAKKRLPNFLSLDFIEQGTGMQIVNTINKKNRERSFDSSIDLIAGEE